MLVDAIMRFEKYVVGCRCAFVVMLNWQLIIFDV